IVVTPLHESPGLPGRGSSVICPYNQRFSVLVSLPSKQLASNRQADEWPRVRGFSFAKGAVGLFPPPALCERCHRVLARRLVAISRCAVFVVARRPRSTSTDGARAAGSMRPASSFLPSGVDAPGCRGVEDGEPVQPASDNIILVRTWSLST